MQSRGKQRVGRKDSTEAEKSVNVSFALVSDCNVRWCAISLRTSGMRAALGFPALFVFTGLLCFDLAHLAHAHSEQLVHSRRISPVSLARLGHETTPGELRDERLLTAPLALTDAVRLAVQRHPSIADAVSTLAQQAGGIDVARAGYYPQIRVGVGAGSNSTLRAREPSGSSENAGTLTSLQVSQMLYDFGKVSGAVNQSEALAQRQRALVLRQIDAVAQQTAEAVVMAHRYQALMTLAQEQVDAVARVLEMARLRANAGISTRADPIQAESRFDSARANLLQIKAAQAQWQERLGTFLGRGAFRPIAPLPDSLARALDQGPLQDLDSIPEVVAAQAERRAAAANLDIAKAQRYPTISLDATANKALGGINPSTQQRNGSNHTIMINLSSSLYQGGALQAQMRAAAAAEEAARMRIETARLNAEDLAFNLREQVKGAQERLGVLADRRRTIVEVRDLYREQYTLGTRSILDLLSAEQEIYQAAAEQETVLHDLWQNRVNYIGATGQGRTFYGLNNTTVQGLELHP